ncbi:hypothetical protein EV401DRAFT_2061348 [Pisolithus croceorrhizus]|nr:hypothetical protein EV401DRAFT_2061348 [Pisolithus croceorrhizus]
MPLLSSRLPVIPYDLFARLQSAFHARHRFNHGFLPKLFCPRFLSNTTSGTIASPSPETRRRIRTGLEYRDDRPVLPQTSLISMPSRSIFMDLGEIRRICIGRRAQTIQSLGMGEIAVVRTKEHEWLDAREALLLGIPGEVICRDGDTVRRFPP